MGLTVGGDWWPIPCEWAEFEEPLDETEESSDVVGEACKQKEMGNESELNTLSIEI